MKKFVLMLLLVATYVPMLAQDPKLVISDKDGWHKIGETKVDFKNETDQILVIGANRFSSIKIKVTDGSINMESFVIYFDNDEKKTVTLKKEFYTPGETQEVTFGGEKNVQKIEFRYKSLDKNTDKKAHVELWGFKTNPKK
ncbi:hypothetical protein [Flavobacterium sp.]|uniref:hypothetical protein n=1 Tax=Flavobacterium sp. TaxID=239 RepID=UPI002FDCA892